MEANMSSDGQGPYVEDENTQDESSSENDSNPIFVLGNLCIERLTSLFDDQSLHEQQEVHPSLWQDELGRLRVWAASIGIHQSANASSDKTLYNAFFINDQILELLERLRRTVDDLQESLKGSEYGDDIEDEFSDDSAESETELRSIYHAFRDTIDNLFQMSILTERPTRHDRSPTTDPSDSTAFSPIKVQHNLYKSFITAQASSIPKPTAFTSSSELGNEKEVSVPQPDDSGAEGYELNPGKTLPNIIEDIPWLELSNQDPQFDSIRLHDEDADGHESGINLERILEAHIKDSIEEINQINFSTRSSLISELRRIFSEANPRWDMRLQPHMDSHGFFPLSVVAGLKPIKALTTDTALISRLCQELQFIEYQVSANGVEQLRPRYAWHEAMPPSQLRDSLDQNDGSFTNQAVQPSPAQLRLRRAREQLNMNRSIYAHSDFEYHQSPPESAHPLLQGTRPWSGLESHRASRQPTQVIVADSHGRRSVSSPLYWDNLHGGHDILEILSESVQVDRTAGTERSSAAIPPSLLASLETSDSDDDIENGSDGRKKTLKLPKGTTLSFPDDVLQPRPISICPGGKSMQPVRSRPSRPHYRSVDIVKRQEIDGFSPSSTSSMYSGTSGSSRYSSYTASSRYASSSGSIGRRESEGLRGDQNDSSFRQLRRDSGDAENMCAPGAASTGPSTNPGLGDPNMMLHGISTDDQFNLDEFEEHVSHCSQCSQALQNKDGIICPEGHRVARRVANSS